MVGDRDEDMECAKNAGMAFQWAWDFFNREKPE
jgi:phosphoglycolate phosphatase-like HAD superfamily hydrolase